MTQPKAKRLLKNFDFSAEGSAVALVGPVVGGAANGKQTILYKAKDKMTQKRSQAFLKKMQEVTVTMDLPDFLERFFYLWDEDAEALAALMGYVEPPETEPNDPETDPEGYLSRRVGGMVVFKSLREASNLTNAVAALSEEEYLDVLKGQEILEPIIKQAESAKKPKKPVSKKKEKTMTQEVNAELETRLAELTKAADEQKAELAKAAEIIKAFEAEKKAAVLKSKKEILKAAVKDEALTEVIFKGMDVENTEGFEKAVEAIKSLVALVEKSDMFKELGANGNTEEVPEASENLVLKAVKARFK